jgi:PleD family two-component response regulator
MNEMLPNFKHIDINIGLKYLNNNRELYLKILKNFLNRYRDLKLEFLEEGELKDTIHSIKGLSSTLGMQDLSRVATIIHETNNMNMLPEFNSKLSIIIDELKLHLDKKIKTILLINDKIIDIDILIELLGEKYDIVVALDESSALDILKEEEISVVLFDIDTNLNREEIFNKIEQKNIPLILILEDENSKKIDKLILKNRSSNFILKPFNLQKIENCLKNI